MISLEFIGGMAQISAQSCAQHVLHEEKQVDLDKTCKEMLTGTLEIPLPKSSLHQRGTDTPNIYKGPGLVTQDNGGDLQLRFFAQGVDPFEALKNLFPHYVLGQMVPETAMYDFRGKKDSSSSLWTAECLELNTTMTMGEPDFYLKSRIYQLEKKSTRPEEAASVHKVIAFVATHASLAWHEITQDADQKIRDRFKHDTGKFAWDVHKTEKGMWINFSAVEGDIEQSFKSFIHALSIVAGLDLPLMLMKVTDGLEERTRLFGRHEDHSKMRLSAPLEGPTQNAVAEHEFIAGFLNYAEQPHNKSRLIYILWCRIFLARSSAIQISALVLAVTVEGLLKKAISFNPPDNIEFRTQLAEAKKVIEILKDSAKRAYNYLCQSIGNAVSSKAKPKDVLHQLLAEGVITQVHIDSWSRLRNMTSHGDDNDAFEDRASGQKFFNDYHACLDLFYRIVMRLISYRGPHKDYSTTGFPLRSIGS